MKHPVTSKIDFSNFYLLKDSELNQIQEFLRNASLKTARKGEIIYSKSETSKVFFVLSGAIKLVDIRESGTEVVKDILMENDMFGGFSFDQKTSHYEYAKTLTSRATYFTIDLNQFRQILKDNPSISYNFYRILSHKINRLEDRYSNLAFNDTRNRLLHFLKGMGTKESTNSNGTLAIKNFLTQSEMAKMIYVSRQTLSRALKDLRNSGELIYTRNKIEIKTN